MLLSCSVCTYGYKPGSPFDTTRLKRTMGCSNSKSSTATNPSRRKEHLLLRIPGATVHLTGDGEAAELAKGDLTILKITDEDISLATVVKVGPHLQWPLTKDEPVVKLDKLHYLFTLPDKDGSFLNYGVTFAAPDSLLDTLDQFLKEHACLSSPDESKPKRSSPSSYEVYWRDYAPKIDEYNGVLAKAIAQGTGQIVKGIFTLSNAYTGQVQKGANLIQPTAVGSNANVSDGKDRPDQMNEANKKHGGLNQSLRRVRKLSEMTERMSQSLLNGILAVTGSVSAPLFRSSAGKAFFNMLPGEVLLASLAAVGTVLDAVEVAERKTLAATSGAVAGAVHKTFGESAGEATEDAFATAGHAIGTAWNVFKIRKAFRPSSTLSSAIVQNAERKRT